MVEQGVPWCRRYLLWYRGFNGYQMLSNGYRGSNGYPFGYLAKKLCFAFNGLSDVISDLTKVVWNSFVLTSDC